MHKAGMLSLKISFSLTWIIVHSINVLCYLTRCLYSSSSMLIISDAIGKEKSYFIMYACMHLYVCVSTIALGWWIPKLLFINHNCSAAESQQPIGKKMKTKYSNLFILYDQDFVFTALGKFPHCNMIPW